jgi:hypothetical protein
LYKTLALTGGDRGRMTISDGQTHVTGHGGGTEESILNLADGDIHLCQDGPRDAPAFGAIASRVSEGCLDWGRWLEPAVGLLFLRGLWWEWSGGTCGGAGLTGVQARA